MNNLETVVKGVLNIEEINEVTVLSHFGSSKENFEEQIQSMKTYSKENDLEVEEFPEKILNRVVTGNRLKESYSCKAKTKKIFCICLLMKYTSKGLRVKQYYLFNNK